MTKYVNVIPEVHADIAKVYGFLINEFMNNFGKEKSRALEDYVLEGSSLRKFGKLGRLKTLVRVDCTYHLLGESNKQITFLLKYRAPSKKNLPLLLRRDSKGRAREYRDYKVLEGISSVPRAFIIEDILEKQQDLSEEEAAKIIKELKVFPRSIILEYVGNYTLDKKLKTEYGFERKDARKQVIEDVLEHILDFEIEATQRARNYTVSGNGLGGLFDERSMDERILDYIRALIGEDSVDNLPEDLKRELLRTYASTKEDYEKVIGAPVVCHGDLTTSNIIIGKSDSSEKQKYYFVDYQLKWRDSIIEIASLLSSPGVNLGPSEWEDIARKFKILGIKKMGGVPIIKRSMSSALKKLMHLEPTMELKDDVEKAVLGSLHRMILHYSLRNSAIISDGQRFDEGRKYKDRKEEKIYRGDEERDMVEMEVNIRSALDNLINSPERLGLTQEEAALYNDFRKILDENVWRKSHKEQGKEDNKLRKPSSKTRIGKTYKSKI